MKTVRMGEMTVRDLERYLETNRTVILPYGVVEQHGHHLPLDTDIRLATLLGERLAEALGCIVAPTLSYCFSGGLLAGTVNVKPTTFANLVGEIVESLVCTGFRNIAILPGHGGSESLHLLKESLRILKWLNPALADVLLLLVPPWEFSPTYMNGLRNRDYHAGESETAFLMALCPETVRKDIVMDAPDVAEALRRDPDSYQERTALTDSGMEIVQTRQKPSVKVGVMGYPERATAATGEAVAREFTENASREIRRLIEQADDARRTGTRVDVPTPEELRLLKL